jgi:hypothetical protein
VTLQPSATGERLRTAHVQVALRRILGIDQTPLAQQYPLDVPEIDLLDPAHQSGVAVSSTSPPRKTRRTPTEPP